MSFFNQKNGFFCNSYTAMTSSYSAHTSFLSNFVHVSTGYIVKSFIFIIILQFIIIPAYAQNNDEIITAKNKDNIFSDLFFDYKGDIQINLDAAEDFQVNSKLQLEISKEFASDIEIEVDLSVSNQDRENNFSIGGRYSGLEVGGDSRIEPNQYNDEIYLREASLSLKSKLGRITLGPTAGFGQSFSVLAPSIFKSANIGAWQFDGSGLNDINTLNDVTAYSKKISYEIPSNLFGGVFGSLRFGISYTPTLFECKESACNSLLQEPIFTIQNQNANIVNPAIYPPIEGILFEEFSTENAFEFGLYYQKLFGDVAVGLGASYITAEANNTTNDVLNNGEIESLSLGLNAKHKNIIWGGSLRSSKIDFESKIDEGYLAFDTGLTYEKGDWSFMFGVGGSDSKSSFFLPEFKTNMAIAGLKYEFIPNLSVGAAARHIKSERKNILISETEETSLVFESSFKF